MREIRLYGSEGGGAARSPYPYQTSARDALDSRFRGNDDKSTVRGMKVPHRALLLLRDSRHTLMLLRALRGFLLP